MSIESDLQEIEVSLDQAKEVVEQFQAFKRLVDNKDFKLIIEKGYFEDEAIRLVAAKSSHGLTPDDQAEIDKDIIGVGRLRQYFMAIHQRGVSAEHAVTAYAAERESILAEDADI